LLANPGSTPLPPSGGWKARKILWVVGIVVVAAIASVAVPYGLSYQSVKGLTVEIVQVSRTYTPGTVASIEFDLSAHVWSTNSLDTRIDQVQFALWVDDIPFPAIDARGSTFSPNSYLQYDLRFVDHSSQDASLLAGRSSHQITLSIATLVQAGFYSTSLAPSTSRAVQVHRVIDQTINPTSPKDCQMVNTQVSMSQPGGVTISMSSSPDTLLLSISDSRQNSVFNQESTSLNSVLRLPAETYTVLVQNPGFFCSGATDQITGSVQFWHEQTVLA
jgi:hypothetical protein